MGRPRLYEERRIATAVRLPASLHKELRQIATSRDVSVNFLVTRAVADYLGRLPTPDREFGKLATSSRSDLTNGRSQ